VLEPGTKIDNRFRPDGTVLGHRSPSCCGRR
jgi:hypothetical protein